MSGLALGRVCGLFRPLERAGPLMRLTAEQWQAAVGEYNRLQLSKSPPGLPRPCVAVAARHNCSEKGLRARVQGTTAVDASPGRKPYLDREDVKQLFEQLILVELYRLKLY